MSRVGSVLAGTRFRGLVLIAIVAIPLLGVTTYSYARERGEARQGALALTGMTGPNDAVNILQAGADAYRSKPVDIAELRAIVAALVNEPRTQGAPR